MAAVEVTQLAERAPRVAGEFIAPARDREFVPAAGAAAVARDHHVVAADGQQMQGGIGASEYGPLARP